MLKILKALILKKKLRFNKYLLKINKFVLTFVKAADIVHDKKSNKTIQSEKNWLESEAKMAVEKDKDIKEKKKTLTVATKYLLDFMFYAGILVTATLPFSVKKIGEVMPQLIEHYEETVIIYFVLGVSACVLLRELRRIFRSVLAENCFVQENVVSLRKMGNWSFFIALMSVVRSIVYMTVAMAVVVLVFIIAGLFSKVLSYVFQQAVEYKEENDLTV